MGAQPMGAPGWPELAACTWSADRIRTVFTHFSSKELVFDSSAMVQRCFDKGSTKNRRRCALKDRLRKQRGGGESATACTWPRSTRRRNNVMIR